MNTKKATRDKRWRKQQKKLGFKLVQVKIPAKDTARLKAYAAKLVAAHNVTQRGQN